MFKNYIIIAWRNLMKHKVFSFINIFGLAVGLTCCMLISLYIYNELSYDTYHRHSDRIYQLGSTFIQKGKETHSANTSSPTAKAMQQEFPEIQEVARMMRLFLDDKTLLQYKEPAGSIKSFYEMKGYIADSSFFNILTYSFKEGNPATALIEPNSVVLSEEVAQKFFGKEQALNKIIRISSSTNGDYDFRVTGVFKESPLPSHIDARFFMSLKGGEMEEFARSSTSFASNNMFYSYFLLKEGADAKKLESKFPAFIDKYAGKELKALSIDRKHFLTSVKDVHLYSGTSENVTPGGSVTYLFILGSIAVLTLLIACINFMNLSTSRSSKRSVEVGVRKVLGAEKSSLIRQFLGESLVMATIAFLLATLFTMLLLPLFEQVSGREIAISFKQHAILFFSFVLLAICTGLLAGSYPAFYLSSFKPVRVLKGRFSNSLAATSLRKVMVVFQFVISIALIVASVVIANQMTYMRSQDLGFVKDQQIILPLRSSAAKNLYSSLKNEIARNQNVSSVGASMYYPGIYNPMDWLLYKEGKTMNESNRVYINYVDNSFLQTLDIKSVVGRSFSPEFPADTNKRMIINEEAVKQLGFANAQEAVGKWVAFDWEGSQLRYDVVGVVKDFHFKDLHVAIEPYGFLLSNNNFNYLVAHTTGNVGSTLQSIENVWRRLNPNEPFEYSFLDQDFQKNYLAENRLASLINYFTVIAIVISCLGLFGLATFSAEQRIKEIGVRKVLGASITSLVALLSKDFIKLVIIAIVIASPIAWYVMNRWLQNFAYRITISWDVFVLTTTLAVLIALFTIGFQAVRAALANPVKNLRTE